VVNNQKHLAKEVVCTLLSLNIPILILETALQTLLKAISKSRFSDKKNSKNAIGI